MLVYKFTCSLPNWYIFMQIQDVDLLKYIRKTFASFVCTELTLETNVNECISIYNVPTGYIIGFKTEVFQTSHRYEEVLFLVYEFFEKSAMQYQHINISSFHGGVLTRKGTAIALLAKTHVGKSTLMANMISQQINCLSDDCVYVDNVNNCVYEFPLPIRIRDFTYVDLDRNAFKIVDLRNCYTGEKEYFVISPNIENKSKPTLKYFVFLERGNDVEYATISSLQCYRNLLFGYKTLEFENKKLDIACLAKKIPGLTLKYNKPNDAISILNKLFD